jgi:hypothetical protein
MKSISITAWKRPEYLQQVLASIKACKHVEEYELFLSLEPGCEDTLKLANSIDWIKTHVRVNKTKLGVRENPYSTLEWVFQSGSIFNVYVEEDVVLAPDALVLANWFLNSQNERDWLCLNFLDYQSSEKEPLLVRGSKRFNALGICIKLHAWNKWFRKNWFNDKLSTKVFSKHCYGWDWSVSALLATQKNLLTLTPALSRSNHIGRLGGVHASADFHDATFGNLIVSSQVYIGDFYIAQDAPTDKARGPNE